MDRCGAVCAEPSGALRALCDQDRRSVGEGSDPEVGAIYRPKGTGAVLDHTDRRHDPGLDRPSRYGDIL